MTAARDVTSTSAQSRDRRKRHGVFYTPEPVASYMVASTFQRWTAGTRSRSGARGDMGVVSGTAQAAGFSSDIDIQEPVASDRPLTNLRVVDPACGEGALLWPAYQLLCQQAAVADGQSRLDIIRRQMFGVDLDPQSVETLRQRFRSDLAGRVAESELELVLITNFRCGNAVAGHGWDAPAVENSTFHWSTAFPGVCAAGGFDVVLANPPYRRERGAKLDLAGLEDAPLTQRWRQARMDLWHYFFHRSLDLLRPGGLLTFIVNSYWTTSHAGRPLIERLAAEATPLEFVLLDAAPVFAGVNGRHLIMQLRKGVTSEPCQVLQLQQACHSAVSDQRLWADLLADRNGHVKAFAQRQIQRDELFNEGRICLEPKSMSQLPRSGPAREASRTLGDLFEVRQGIAENPPRVTRKQALEHPEYRTGEGVFVLTAEELQQLNLSVTEGACVRPYYSAAEISRDWSPAEPTRWLLYLTRDTAAELSALPNIARHLARFRPLLERRRETQQGKVPWWHLHWPRESRLFEQPRILAVQMCREPLFAYVERPTYVGFSTNLIVEKVFNGLSLPALAAILNSRWARDWFTSHAKRRGVNLDITGSTLKNFPLPEIEPADEDALVRLSREHRDAETDELVGRLYQSH